MKFKTLIFKEGTKYQEFLHYINEVNEWGTSSTPNLMPLTATLDLVKTHYPELDLTDVTLVTIEVKIIAE
jgi:hypothetical protein